MVLQLRDYQAVCVERAKEANTIINLPTGKGKTLIAARLIDHYLEKHPDKRIAFLVPTRPLVDQQAKYIETHCRVDGTKPTVVRLIGTDQASWSQEDWDDSLNDCHILLGTAALFQSAFVTDKFVSFDRISLVVYDECHNAVGNSPMATIMRDGVAPYVTEGSIPPRILGLTASFVNGSMKNIIKKRNALESLMNSTIFAPKVDSTLKEESYVSVNWLINPSTARQIEVVGDHVSKATNRIAVKDVKRVISRSTHVFAELGLTPLMFYMEKVVVKQMIDKASGLEGMGDSQCTNLARKIRWAVPMVRSKMIDLAANLRNEPELDFANEKSNKLLKLVEILKNNFREQPDSYRGIVFVEQVALASTLAKEINDSLAPIQCGAVAGTGHQTESDRQEQLDLFTTGECRILVATATLEEGIDVSECQFVARFNVVQTTKAHIQGSGRARHANAKIYYFVNDPTTERAKAHEMTAIASDATLASSELQLNQAMRDMDVFSSKHPYPSRHEMAGSDVVGVVSIFNCKQIFNNYCSIMLQKSLSAEKHLYTYKEVGDRKILDKIRYPTPSGWDRVCSSDYKDYWYDTDMDQVFEEARTKKKSSSEKEEMAFVYIAVVDLREKGYIDRHNKPTTDMEMRANARRNCPMSDRTAPDGLNIKDNVFQSHNSGVYF
ncbi:hypothetical protein ACHAXR_004449 [Thalassiosira sp. AJA248-18]